MPSPIEDYAWIGDQRTGALISREGSIDWMCVPRFDSPAVFCALLGDDTNGRWKVSVRDGQVVERHYEGDTMVLRTHWEGPGGAATVTDFMPVLDHGSQVVRTVTCTAGRVTVEQELALRFSYGSVVPWVRRVEHQGATLLAAVAGASQVHLSGPLPTPEDHRHTGSVELGTDESVCWVLTSSHSWQEPTAAVVPDHALKETIARWRAWSAQVSTDGPYAPYVRRSLLVLNSLTHRETGGIVAAPTTSLPEDFGGERNWDYRFCWLRDAALTLEALLAHGLDGGATAWRDWLLRAVAGDFEDLQIMYGVDGDRELPERELDHLPGYAGSRPVRVGNGAVAQYQADVIGEVMLALAQLRDLSGPGDSFSWSLQRTLLRYLDTHFDAKDHGIWEMRGDPHYFTHGRVMMWAAFDQGLRAVAEHGLPGDVELWERRRAQLEAEIWERGYDEETSSFTQTYGGSTVDASLLQLPHTGFVPHDHPAMVGTVRRIEAELVDDHGFVRRYLTDGADGLAGEEAPFLICTFWLVEHYAHVGRVAEATALMDTLVSITSEVGLLAEEYDPVKKRHAGNYPQAFSHLALVRAADALAQVTG